MDPADPGGTAPTVTANEPIRYEGLRLTPEGSAEKFILMATTPTVAASRTNPSGACCPRPSAGQPAWRNAPSWSGNCAGRPTCGKWKARLALQHNLGLGRRLRRHAVPGGMKQETKTMGTLDGKVALVSDPGRVLTRHCAEAGA